MQLRSSLCVVFAIYLALWAIELGFRQGRATTKQLTLVSSLIDIVDDDTGVKFTANDKHKSTLVRKMRDEFVNQGNGVPRLKSTTHDHYGNKSATHYHYGNKSTTHHHQHGNKSTTHDHHGNKSITHDRQGNKSECERCDQLRDLKDEQAFQHVDKKNNSFVFSALWDSVEQRKQRIRIAGMIHRDKPDNSTWYCYIRDRETKRCIQIVADPPKRPFFRKGWISGRIFYCPLPSGIVPEGVSLMTNEHGPLYNKMPVFKNEGNQGLQYNFTMCVSPIHSDYNNTRQLITFIELSTILGADYFVFYNTSMSKSVEQIVLKMTVEGSAMVVQWQLPEGPVLYYGQVPMLNDCMNRMIYRTRIICETDLDEFIIPKKYRKWQDLIDEKQKASPLAGVFLSPSDYYLSDSPKHSYKYPGRDVAEMYDVRPLLSLLQRTDIGRRLWKYMYDPKKVENLSVHNATLRRPWRAVHFKNEDATFHHYRKVFKKEYKRNARFRTITTMLRYKDELLSRIQARVMTLEAD